ncbi:hypothetical protein PSHI8_17010 [Polynucleobacter sp. SHI8]|uniref:NAD(P)H-hydrate dehydratase n=1 Tax=unclassified Polynucleobacter TaxID=2640945 RepID=UPI0024914C2B|nr:MULTISPECIES: NAD(P)H-hydrate dehydratase [unclassified Polynucleobacter]BDW11618.1 hypothetical protein PSHI2_17000 [Polynucleobacter sp. SHI2]BDW14065.1 hypothetical protein PSHI8_17010 [Polynucleobacter sp. SHI8]
MQILHSLHLINNLRRDVTDHKGTSGKLVIIGGASTMSGSIALAGLGALYTGSGWVKLIPLDPDFPNLIDPSPELMIYHPGQRSPAEILQEIKPDVIVIGPGLGQSASSLAWLEATLEYQSPLVIDADGLNLLSQHPELHEPICNRSHRIVMTPHPGEAGRLLHSSSQVMQSDRMLAMKQLIAQYQAIVILKGHHSLVGMPAQDVLTCISGNSGMACAGMGDVLSGALGSFIAQGLHHNLSTWQAACLAVEVHARAGDLLVEKGIGPIGMTPSELAKEMRTIVNSSSKQSS